MTIRAARRAERARESQSAFVRGFIDDSPTPGSRRTKTSSLNPRSCAASSMTGDVHGIANVDVGVSQSAFVRGFIDDIGLCPRHDNLAR